jgi:hypothetical protein
LAVHVYMSNGTTSGTEETRTEQVRRPKCVLPPVRANVSEVLRTSIVRSASRP